MGNGGAGGASSAGGGAVTLEGLEKRFADQVAVAGIDLEICAGEFFSLLGPSGCGKTTTLRMIAGFEQPTAGRVLIDGVDVSRTAPDKRPVNTVFQSYALFPHLSVLDNVAFGLRFTGASKTERKARASQALEMVRLTGFEKRKPHQLSGGQQQRVALARALVLRPRVLLLDEPLGALDAKLRKQLQIELATLQREVGITFIYVTHDQEEALTMSDRLVVMDQGRIAQCGTPREVYEEPADAYVADFLGVANLLPARVVTPRTLEVAGTALEVEAAPASTNGDAVRVLVRPERVRVCAQETQGPNTLPATVVHVVYAGSVTQVQLRLDDGSSLQAMLANDGDSTLPTGSGRVAVQLAPSALRVIAG
jgi:spermidine/putrescine transport system ATP-binding protein